MWFLLWLTKKLPHFSCFISQFHTRDPHSTSNLFYQQIMSYINLPSLQDSPCSIFIQNWVTRISKSEKEEAKKKKKVSFRSSFSSLLVWILQWQVICSSLHDSSFSSEATLDLVIFCGSFESWFLRQNCYLLSREFLFDILFIFRSLMWSNVFPWRRFLWWDSCWQ